ncbi:esterase-like activity of phytase family protein [Synechocystis sp. PCC 7509]|uniref:esterase-like activity of phytase family protein n=1 Tax=Synechocystis sp. PCC 7509 TaxID=927677 RepID=UPI0002AD18FE|nr:esterase-like activity of phytase family protein [Synechocystis sp. PCC 7509]
MSNITQVLPLFKLIILSLLSITATTLTVMPSMASTIKNIDFLGEVTFSSDTQVKQTLLGGLSGITYDASKNVYYSISDDRSQNNPARFYTLTIELKQNSLGAVKFTDVTLLKNQDGQNFPAQSLDPEGIALTSKGILYISSEGDATATNLTNPFVNEFSITGEQLKALPVDDKYFPTAPQTSGIRTNLAFESLTITPSQNYLFTATENALVQDGAIATVSNGSPSRIVGYNTVTGKPAAEYLYFTDKVANPPITASGFNTNGLVDLLAIDDKHFLSLERSFSVGAGNTIKLYEVSLEGADNIRDINSLSAVDITNIKPAKKELLLDFDKLNITLDNIEGLTFGPDLPDGKRSLIVVSDNNFSSSQSTQVLAFSVEPVPEPEATAGLAALVVAGLVAKRKSKFFQRSSR